MCALTLCKQFTGESRLNISLLCFRTLLGSTCNRVFWVGSLRIKQNHASFTVQFDPEPVCVTQHGKSGKSATSLGWSWKFQPNLFSSSPFVIGVDVLYPPLSLLPLSFNILSLVVFSVYSGEVLFSGFFQFEANFANVKKTKVTEPLWEDHKTTSKPCNVVKNWNAFKSAIGLKVVRYQILSWC